MEIKESHSAELLLAEFQKRKSRNKAYSLRSFARYLGLPAGRLSQYFSGQRAISLNAAKKIAEKMSLSPRSEEKFLQIIQTEQFTKLPAALSDTHYTALSNDSFTVLSDWKYFAILNLLKVKNFKNDAAWMGQRLGLSARTVTQSLARLKRVGLIEESEGKLKRLHPKLRTSDGVASRALRLSHEQSIQQALDALHSVDLELRDITSITMAIDVKRLPEAKAMIKDFRRRFSNHLENANANEVYNLNIQLVPVTQCQKESLQ